MKRPCALGMDSRVRCLSSTAHTEGAPRNVRAAGNGSCTWSAHMEGAPRNVRAAGNGSCAWSHFSLQAGLRGRCLMTPLTVPGRSAAGRSHSGPAVELGLKPQPGHVCKAPGLISAPAHEGLSGGDSLPWVKYQNHLDGPVTDPALCHGQRQPSEGSGPTLSRGEDNRKAAERSGGRSQRSQVTRPPSHKP